MEHKVQHSRNYSEPCKQVFETQELKSVVTRKKLVEKGFQKDKILSKPRNSSNPRKTERFSLPVQHLSQAKGPIMEKLGNKSGQGVGKSVRKVQNTPELVKNVQYRKKQEKPTDCILRVAEKLSVKKINELYRISTSGDSFVCRALLALLAEVDYHIGESLNFSIESFFEYISMPGIVIQTIKRLPEIIVNERIPNRIFYLECFVKAAELFNQAGEISRLAGVEIIAELLQVVFSYKGIGFKALDLGNYGEVTKVAYRHRPVQSAGCGRVSQADEVPLIKILGVEELVPKASPLKPSITKPPTLINPEFSDSKSTLLSKFYTKMGASQSSILQSHPSPLKNLLNLSQDYSLSSSDYNFYIKPKSNKKRSSSLTPTPCPTSSSSHSHSSLKKPFLENRSNKSINREKIEDIKKTQFLLGSRFYKKIDQKFVEKLLEKMKKESLEVKRMRTVNFEEYVKRKNHYIAENKQKWVVETLRYLETSDLLVPVNENDLGQDARHDALLMHLNQEQHVSSLVRKAEQMEVALRRGCNY